jgi:hypothetical protein
MDPDTFVSPDTEQYLTRVPVESDLSAKFDTSAISAGLRHAVGGPATIAADCDAASALLSDTIAWFGIAFVSPGPSVNVYAQYGLSSLLATETRDAPVRGVGPCPAPPGCVAARPGTRPAVAHALGVEAHIAAPARDRLSG